MLKRTRFLLILTLVALLVIPGILLVHPGEAQILGTNWVGTFYNGTTLSGTPIATNIQYPTGLCFVWGTGAPTAGSNTQCTPGPAVAGAPADNFSASFASTQNFSQTGSYLFTVRVDDGIRIYIDNAVVLDQFKQTNQLTEYTFTVSLAAGNHSIRVEYVEFTGSATIQVQWGFSSGGGGTAAGPTATPVPAATGQVITVKGLALRTGPYLGASLIGVARPGTTYPITEQNNDEGLFTWYKITAGDNSGWVSGRYFEVSGNLGAIPVTGTIFDSIDDAPDKGVVGVTRSVMNLRRRPSERATLLDKVPWGAEVPVIGRTIQGGKPFWLQVRYNGKVGWIYAPYVGLRGIVDAVPIR